VIRILNKLLFRNIIPPFVISLLVLTFVLFFQFIGNRSELLISKNASLDIILAIAGALLPQILIYSLPLSFLIGILIGLSGLSGESQITALRACGIPIRALLKFILLCALIVGVVTALFSTIILPRANYTFARMIDRVSLTLATSLVRPRVFNEELPGIVFYIADLAADKQHWSRVFLVDNSNPSAPRTIIAQYGSWVGDAANRRLQLHLDNGRSYSIDMDDPSKDNVGVFASTDIPINANAGTSSSSQMEPAPRKVAEQSTAFLWSDQREKPPSERIERLVELHKRIALPFSVFPFALLGIALAAGSPKGSKTSGFALSLITVIVFYILFANGIRLAKVEKLSPLLGTWSANILLMAVALFLMARVEHSSKIIHWLSGITWKLKRRTLGWSSQPEIQNGRPSVLAHTILQPSSYARFKFPKVLDSYISKGFFISFLWSLITCGTLFVLLTLFDLLDDIIRNSISISGVIDYFVFLTPQILMIVIPMSVLLAILINFGILEKNSEVTAIKAGGWSLYRIAIPVFLIASALCLGLFLMQDYILPYANVRQESIRNIIKGRPPQTSSRMQRKWIIGESSRIYNYEYFDGNQDSFVNLNVYDTDLATVQILRRVYAARAHIDKNGTWTLEDGWIRDYQSTQQGFRRIAAVTMHFPEKAGYFEREIFQPKESSKRTYLELKNYIGYLKKTGYNAAELQVELHKKVSFPLSCLIMAVLGIPFSFSTGKKGAFFGIGISIAIAISYWGISGVFEALGSYGLLIPILAAWAPNILFGAAGLALLLTIRT
jgi:LPS export ABC transporter permease LptG/LPS export ABC transporter permease LptF